MKASDISFTDESHTTALDLNLDEDFLDNSSPQFEDSLLNLSSLDAYQDFQDEEKPPLSLDHKQKCDLLVEYLDSNPLLTLSLNKAVTDSKLNTLSEVLGYNVNELYSSDLEYNMLLNALAQGIVITANSPSSIKSPVKMFYAAGVVKDSIHMHKPSGTNLTLYKTTPVLNSFDKPSIDSLSAFYAIHSNLFQGSLHSFVKDTTYNPVSVVGNGDSAYLAFDNLTLASKLLSRGNVTGGLKKLKALGASEVRLNKIALLVKTLKDNK